MLILALNFLLGILVFSLKNTVALSTLEITLFFILAGLVFATFKAYKTFSKNLILFIAGFVWMGIFSTNILHSNISEEFFNKPVSVVGKIQNLPDQSEQKTRFNFQVSEPFQAKLKLSWYGQKPEILNNDDTWKLLVKIKHNNSYQNQGGFDYEQWLFYQQFDATGYVKRSKANQLVTKSSHMSVDSIRQNIRQKLATQLADLTFLGVINALVIGDRSLISRDHWDLFKATNTTHLSVISGLHIGLISGFIFIIASFIWRHCTRCTFKIPANVIGAYFGLASALIYALIAGFSIPTQRAFIMASVVFLSLILRRHHNTWQLYGVALILVLFFNPLSVFSAGFWLSFYVVAVIIYGVGQHKNRHWFVRLLYIQLLISLATLPLIAWFFHSGSLLSPVANLVAIPIFSFITTPFSLLGALFLIVDAQFLSEASFAIANQSLIYLSSFLEYLTELNFNLWHYTQHSSFDLVVLIMIVLFALLPGALKLRKIAVFLVIIIWIHPAEQIQHGNVKVTVLDVGQGLAQVVRTKNHTLLFDTGAKYPSGFNMGDAVIIPYLRSQHINLLDLIIISHGDNDHIGGLDSILKNIKHHKILSSVPEKISTSAALCQTQSSWNWDGVDFQMLNIRQNFSGNNASCVLKISTQKHAIILTGDIERKAEQHLIDIWGSQLKSDILISPHHGSKTSSSDQFLTAVKPQHVIVSSGYKNRFNHPAKLVAMRYKNHKIQMLNTSCTGQIDILMTDQDKIHLSRYRQSQQRYYQRHCLE
ncbi:MAG: DNA internalization-related competence protein ComEC/Rec2 [Proteobacteria bacterium]|nr:DNA internalization-related competence protein ComEC/Rec2 [Pseudomonadota bacterium]MCH9712242.1 DNA internalization-related competence protein ComEC/Rec2 [Pseudomonadota bacterium]MCH9750137.1 DNA internalization-related competence protein ComEC/Rec2 [Pseudomonadota bacterium]